METFRASDAKNQFGRLLDAVRRSPISIEKLGRPVAIVISPEEYKRLDDIENKYWAIQAKLASSEGYLSEQDSEDLLKDLGE